MVNSPDADILSEGEDFKLKSCDMKEPITHGGGGGGGGHTTRDLKLIPKCYRSHQLSHYCDSPSAHQPLRPRLLS